MDSEAFRVIPSALPRAELRPHGLAGNEVRVCRQTRVQVLLGRVVDGRRSNELPGRQPDEVVALTTIVIAVPAIVIAVTFLTMVGAFLQIGVRWNGQHRRRREDAQSEQMLQRSLRHVESFLESVKRSHDARDT